MDTLSIILITSILSGYLLVIILVLILNKRNEDYIAEHMSDYSLARAFSGWGSCRGSSESEALAGSIICGIFFDFYPFFKLTQLGSINYMRRKADRESEKLEREEKERKLKGIDEFEENYQQKRKETNEKVKELRARGFKAEKWDKKKVLEIISYKSKINLSFIHKTTGIPEAEIIIIIEDEPDFEIQEEFIINKINY